ncbi:MAG: glycosyltransferase family 4 protein [Chloroflexi bacterium]|uniref:Glycosyltransferase family 4 protein n=1 Tax=Candidatus Chlorohelix allophototropha TaxID=3003348 RepID=A0A8T7LZG2_9CHLR|nr:glycosyltransferase family 4 protein [Chloroflexota bacterium]WJW66673.1 glycosyltransferase family 4 protein [Chloroflexota bacterium L227-S17]
MKIGIDASRLAVGKRTGTENYAYQVTRRIIENRQHDFALYFNKPPTSLQLHGLNLGKNVTTCAMPAPRLWTHTRLSFEMLIHAPDALFIPAHVLPLYHPLRSVVTIHDLGYLYHPEAHTPLSRMYLNWSTRFSALKSRLVISVSQATANDLERHYGISPEKIRVIPHGYDREQFKPIKDSSLIAYVRTKYNIEPGPYIFYVGTIQPRKNLERLMEAFAALVRDENFDYPARHQLQLVLGGKPGWMSEPIMQKAVALNLPEQIKLVGYVSDMDLPALYSGAEAFTFPSLYEGFGLPALEAMACGVPVICSNAGSLPEVVGDAALLHHPLDAKAIEWNLRRLLCNPQLRGEMINKGLRRAALFSWEKCADETLATLMEVAGKK